MTRLLFVSALVAAILAGAAPVTASAATVVRVGADGFGQPQDFVEGDGADNQLRVAMGQHGVTPSDLTVTDSTPGDMLVDGDGPGGCEVQPDGRHATCPHHALLLTAGDGSDTITDVSLADPEDFGRGVTLDGGPGNDVITAHERGEHLLGGPGDDRLTGGTGHDSLQGGSGTDELIGGEGVDVATYSDHTAAVRLTNDGVRDDGEPGEGDDVAADVEGLEGGDGDDVLIRSGPTPCCERPAPLTGNGGNDQLIGNDAPEILGGGDGNDTLTAAGGTDRLDGNAGDDALDGGAGADILEVRDHGADDAAGGPGIDSVTYSGVNGPVRITLDGVADDGQAGEGDNVRPDVEDLVGTERADTIIANDAFNVIDSGDGDDAVDPGGNGDFVTLGAGDDRVTARDGTTDRIDCGAGSDSATLDAVDETTGCEAEDRAAPFAPDRGPGAGGTGLTPAIDTTRPVPRLTGLSRRMRRATLLARGLRFTLGASERVRSTVELSRGRVRVTRTLGPTTTPSRFVLRIPSRLAATLPRRSFTLRLSITAIDDAGNRSVLRRSIRILGRRG